MQVTAHRIKGLLEIQPRIFEDERGYFFESYNKQAFAEAGLTDEWVQDNQSISSKNVLRGMHFQRPPYAQAKLVRVATGRALDAVIDLRHGSPTFGQWATFELDSKKQNMVYVPAGFAHGFLALEDNTIFVYKCTNVYHKASEGGILWNDPAVGINWGVSDPIVSEKDQQLEPLSALEPAFQYQP
jgi:dTDP-4-dehydrorhamnose 3,5-epimerase